MYVVIVCKYWVSKKNNLGGLKMLVGQFYYISV